MSPFLQELKDYFKTRLDLLKYESIESGSSIIAEMIVHVLFVITMAMSFILFTVALAFYLDDVLKSYWLGFAIVSIIYLLIVIFGGLLKKPLQNRLISYLIRRFIR